MFSTNVLLRRSLLAFAVGVILCVVVLLQQGAISASAEDAANLGMCSYPPTGYPAKRALEACTWYSDSSCCTVKDSQEIKANWEDQESKSNFTIPDWINPLAPCMDELKMLSCLQCSPDQPDFIEMDPIVIIKPVAIRLCESFCNRIYTKCAAAQINGKTVALNYKNGEDLCLRAFADNTDLEIKVVDSQCFNSGDQLGFSIIKTLFVSVVVLLAIKQLF